MTAGAGNGNGSVEILPADVASPPRHLEGTDDVSDESVNQNNNDSCDGTNCMPLTESFHDVDPPITECFKCDVEVYEHKHEIGPHHHHSQSVRDESANDVDAAGAESADI